MQLIKRKPVKWVPHKYQKQSTKFLVEHAAAALLLDPGLGKSSITLSAIAQLKRRGLLNKVLIIAPLRVCHDVWPCEVEKWGNFGHLKVVVLHGKNKQILLDEGGADIYVTNPEGLDWLLGVKKIKTITGKTRIHVSLRDWNKLGFDTLVLDELSKFKHTNTNRFKALKKVLPTFARRWGLTGSPASNGLMGLFGQMYCLDEGAALGSYITQYREKYFTPDYMGYNWELKPGASEQIYEAIRPLALRIGAEVLDMPQLVENDIVVALPDKAMKLYKKLEDDFMVEVKEGKVTAANAAAASSKCRQIANGAVYLTPEVIALVRLPATQKKHAEVHTAKFDALSDLVDELQGSPLLVAYEFKHELELIRKRFGKDVPVIGGGTSSKKASQLVQQWNDGELPVLFGHPQSIAHGVNLQDAGHHVAWLSITWNYELYEQFLRRVLRQGNTSKRVYVHRIIARGTIDGDIVRALRRKGELQNALFSALKNKSLTS